MTATSYPATVRADLTHLGHRMTALLEASDIEHYNWNDPSSSVVLAEHAYELIGTAETRWRKISAPDLAALVRAGARFENGALTTPEDV